MNDKCVCLIVKVSDCYKTEELKADIRIRDGEGRIINFYNNWPVHHLPDWRPSCRLDNGNVLIDELAAGFNRCLKEIWDS